MQAADRDLLNRAASLVDAARARLSTSRGLHIESILARSYERMRVSRGLLAPTREAAAAPAPRPAAPAFDVLCDSLARRHWRGLNAIASSGPAFEPLSRYAGVGPRIADWLTRRGLAESRPEPQPLEAALFYRATALGRQVLQRGRHARRGCIRRAPERRRRFRSRTLRQDPKPADRPPSRVRPRAPRSFLALKNRSTRSRIELKRTSESEGRQMLESEARCLASQSARLVEGSRALVVSSIDIMAQTQTRAFSTMAAISRSRRLLYRAGLAQGGFIGPSDIPVPGSQPGGHDRH